MKPVRALPYDFFLACVALMMMGAGLYFRVGFDVALVVIGALVWIDLSIKAFRDVGVR
jgi:hypothetical protein